MVGLSNINIKSVYWYKCIPLLRSCALVTLCEHVNWKLASPNSTHWIDYLLLWISSRLPTTFTLALKRKEEASALGKIFSHVFSRTTSKHGIFCVWCQDNAPMRFPTTVTLRLICILCVKLYRKVHLERVVLRWTNIFEGKPCTRCSASLNKS